MRATGGGYDIILATGGIGLRAAGITRYARELNFNLDKLLFDWITCIPGFTLEKYFRLQSSRPSIFSVNCFGGCISKMLGLPFRSPFINLYLSVEDFINFLRAPCVYLEYSPHFERILSESKSFPVLSLGDVILNMKHYKTADDAIKKWNERKQRINFQNLIAISYAENEETARAFDELPYDKKICFVPFKSDFDSAWYIDLEIDKSAMATHGRSIRRRLDNFGAGNPFYYDLFDMLLYGKKTPLIEM